MRCNVNFNQCNTGCSFPCPLFTCCRNFRRLFSDSSSNTVINPPLNLAFAQYANTAVQTVPAGGILLLNFVGGGGSGIIADGAGNYNLTPGTYRLIYNANGIIPAGGLFSLGLYQNGVLIPNSLQSIFGASGSVVNLSADVLISVTGANDIISFVNTAGESEVVNQANLNITRIG